MIPQVFFWLVLSFLIMLALVQRYLKGEAGNRLPKFKFFISKMSLIIGLFLLISIFYAIYFVFVYLIPELHNGDIIFRLKSTR